MDSPIPDGKKTDRNAAGQFIAGNKASPGRPPGRGAVAELRAKLSKDVDSVIEIVRQRALEGDPQAIRIWLDRVLPSLRPVEVETPIDLPNGNLAQQAQAVVQAVANGDIAPSQAAQLVGALGGIAKIVETTELLERIEKLEAARAKSQ